MQATSADLGNPEELAFDAAGNLYISDAGNRQIFEVTSDGVIHTAAGDGAFSYSGDGGGATAAGFTDTDGITSTPPATSSSPIHRVTTSAK